MVFSLIIHFSNSIRWKNTDTALTRRGQSVVSSLLGRNLLLLALLVLLRLLGAALRQRFRALDWLTEQHTVVDDRLLQLLVLRRHHTVALGTGQAKLEAIKVRHVEALQEDIENGLETRSSDRMDGTN